MTCRSSLPDVFFKKVFIEISQNSSENSCARVSFLIKLQASVLSPITLLKKRLWHRYFPMNFVKFLRTPFLKEHLWWLLLDVICLSKVCLAFRLKCHTYLKKPVAKKL